MLCSGCRKKERKYMRAGQGVETLCFHMNLGTDVVFFLAYIRVRWQNEVRESEFSPLAWLSTASVTHLNYRGGKSVCLLIICQVQPLGRTGEVRGCCWATKQLDASHLCGGVQNNPVLNKIRHEFSHEHYWVKPKHMPKNFGVGCFGAQPCPQLTPS